MSQRKILDFFKITTNNNTKTVQINNLILNEINPTRTQIEDNADNTNPKPNIIDVNINAIENKDIFLKCVNPKRTYKNLMSDDEDCENSTPRAKIIKIHHSNNTNSPKVDRESKVEKRISKTSSVASKNLPLAKKKESTNQTSSLSKQESEHNDNCKDNQDTVTVLPDYFNFDHLSFEFLKKENIRDNHRRKSDHPDYDPTSLFLPESFTSKLTPCFKQWWKLKCKGNMDTILFFKVGKFYELYHMDAVIAVKELGLSFMRGSFAHSGFPEVAFSKMVDQLVFKGYKVARVEQTETADAMAERIKLEGSKNKAVNREICQIITPGTRGFSLRNATCRESGLEGIEEAGYNDDSGGLLYAFKESVIEDGSISKNRYTVHIGVALVNTNTGKFTISQFTDDYQRSRLRTLISRYPPNEIIYLKGNLSKFTQHVFNSSLAATKKECLYNDKQFLSSENALARLLESDYFTETCPNKLSKFGLPIGLNSVLNENDNLGRSASICYDLSVSCIGALIYYLDKCQIDKYLISIADFNLYIPVDGTLSIANTIDLDKPFYHYQSNMILDSNTLTNLELIKNSNVGGTEGTLLERLDFALTAFGRRLLIQWIATPLSNPQSIIERQDAITELMDNDALLGPIKSQLKTLPDLEKLVAKIHILGMTKSVSEHPDSRAVLYESLSYSRRKINDFITTLVAFDNIIKLQSMFVEIVGERNKSSLLRKIMFHTSEDKIGEFPNISETVTFFQKSFNHDQAKKQGKIIPEKGVDIDYDLTMTTYESIEKELKDHLDEQKRILKCNINYVGTGRNRFQLEIPETKCNKLPSSYVATSQRKGYKRYFNTDIESLFNQFMNAEDKRDAALKNIMSKIFAKFDENILQWNQAINCISQLDALLSLSSFSRGLDGGPMTRPEIRPILPNTKPFLVITEGRYPCKAKCQSGEFISNTIKLGSFLSNNKTNNDNPIMLLTGPNMGGKSTLMRQTALIIILSQLGCYVPAEGPVILTPIDRLFTRQGANDSIVTGQSTLQVEMNETALILSYMTEHSFLLIDELGRGTATYDGCAIAFSILKELADNLKPRTIFSTHFHKLLEENEVTSKMQISHMACMVEDDDDSVLDNNSKLQNITFLYKLTNGGCPKSYGFNAARLANIPEKIIFNGLNKARLFEEETMILEFKKYLQMSNLSLDSMKIWQQKFKKIYNK